MVRHQSLNTDGLGDIDITRVVLSAWDVTMCMVNTCTWMILPGSLWWIYLLRLVKAAIKMRVHCNCHCEMISSCTFVFGIYNKNDIVAMVTVMLCTYLL